MIGWDDVTMAAKTRLFGIVLGFGVDQFIQPSDVFLWGDTPDAGWRRGGCELDSFGQGGKKQVVGDEISYFARICKVMDVYDALTTRRSYKKAMNPFDTLTLMKKQMSDEFDAKILDNFIQYMGPDI